MTSVPNVLPQTLMRSIDLSYGSNRWAVGGSLAALAVARWRGASWSQAGRSAMLTFAAWATARELDPDHPEVATLALPLAALLSWTEEERSPVQAGAEVVASLTALLSLRFLTGSVGGTPGASDHLTLLGAAGGAALGGQRGASLLPALAQGLLDMGAQGQGKPSSWALWAGGLGVLPAVVSPARTGHLTRLVAALALALSTVTARLEQVESQTDQGDAKISARRVQRARVAAQVSLALALLEGRGGAAPALGAASLALGVRRLTRLSRAYTDSD